MPPAWPKLIVAAFRSSIAAMGRRLGPPGALAGVAGSLLLALGAVLLRDLPSTGASALDVYAYFLDNRDTAMAGAAACIGGLALMVPFLATIRLGEVDAPRGSAGTAMLAAGMVAIAAATFAAAIVGGLAVGAENADAASSRTLLDVAGALAGASGPFFAVSILCAAIVGHDGGAPSWVALLWSACALGCILWLGPVASDASILSLGSALGTFAGIAGLVVWTTTATVLGRHPRPRVSLPQ